MGLRYIIVFRPDEHSGDQDDAVMCKQLLLYHAFGATEVTLRQKLGQIGIIQAMWSLSGDRIVENNAILRDNKVGHDSTNEAKIIETENETILTICVEDMYFISLSVSVDNGITVPTELYLGNMWNCYNFFRMKNGAFIDYNNGQLTDLLNEHFIYFWNDLYLRPDLITSNIFMLKWPDTCKMAEMNISSNWETNIIQKILIQDESYLGIKDILVYHIPQEEENRASKKNYGLIRNFNNDFNDISYISNWIYHLQSVYGSLSSHVLAGNVYYQGAIKSDDVDEDGNARNNVSATENQPQTLSQNLSETSSNIFHNMILPFSLAYDTINEVGTTTGVSNSISLIMDYIPRWSRNYDPQNSSKIDNSSNSRSGYLISPLSSNILPASYKLKCLNLKFGNDSRKYFNTLFWYYNDVLVALIFDKDFKKVNDKDYLKHVDTVLKESFQIMYEDEANFNDDVKAESETFAYVVKIKKSDRTFSNFPAIELPKIYDDNIYQTTLELVSNTFDQFLPKYNLPTTVKDGSTEQKSTGIDIMGSIWSLIPDNNNGKNKNFKLSTLSTSECFLDNMQNTKLWDLFRNCNLLLNNLDSEVSKKLQKERLIKTNDGIITYAREDNEKVILVVKKSMGQENTKKLRHSKNADDFSETDIIKSSVFKTLGKSVRAWWLDNVDNFK